MASSPSKGKASALSSTMPISSSPPRRSKSPIMPPSTSPRPRPTPSRMQAYAHASTNALSVPGTPYTTPHVSSVNVVGQKRLLMPTVRSIKPAGVPSPRLPATKPAPSRLGRTRAGSLSLAIFTDPVERAIVGASDWFIGGDKFEVVEEQLELEGFQIYAVEKWVVARKRPVLVLTVFTGDPKHKITVTAFSPQTSLSNTDAQQVWDDAVRNLRRDGARPKETDKGVLMVTSLANFRSDYTIVHVPSGNFLDVREQLYTNVNLSRMGCGGRSALTLEEPSDATKVRFIAMYHVADKGSARSSELFNVTVLELVKFVQASLAIFGMFDLWPEERNGLLCDITCEGIQRWVTEVGEPFLHVEPTERVADPTVIAGLFSLILSTRSKLHALNLIVPKDPFLDPSGFIRALALFHTSKSLPQPTHSHIFSLPNSPTTPSPINNSPSTLGASSSVVFLTPSLIEYIQSHHEKARQSESYKVHRVLKSKLDDLATDLRTHGTENVGSTATTLSVTSDLAAFARCAMTSKDAPPSLRYLWTGRPGQAEKKRREKEAVWSDGEREERDKDKDGEKDGAGKDGRERDDREKDREKEPRSGDEGDRLWRVQRKIESWTGLGKGKKMSVDFGTLGKKAFLPESSRGPSEKSGQSSMVPSVVVSRYGEPADEEELLSSGQQSPISDAPNPLMLGVGSLPHAERSASELSEYDRRVSEFNQKRPHTRVQSRIISWSDTRSARGMLHDGSNEHRVGASPLGKTDSTSSRAEYDGPISMVESSDLERQHRLRLLASGPERRRSFDDAPDFAGNYILPIERMRIDVELCGQLLVMRRRSAHLANVVACLQALVTRLSAQNARLHSDHEGARDALGALDARTGELQRVEALRTEAEALTQETNALAYEGAQFLVDDLWHMAAQPRQRVLALREKVSGTGRRLPQGVRGAHGRFSHVQRTLDGEERLVDRLGRTESEAAEEEEVPQLPGREAEAEDVDVVEHQNLKPTWLLRLFNYWGGRLGLSRTQEPPAAPDAQAHTAAQNEGANGQNEQLGNRKDVSALPNGSSSSVRVPSDDVGSQLLQRTFTA